MAKIYYLSGVTGSIPSGDSGKVTVTVTGQYQGTFSAVVETTDEAVAGRLRDAGFTDMEEAPALAAKKKPLQHRQYGLQPLGGPAQHAAALNAQVKPTPRAPAPIPAQPAEVQVAQVITPPQAPAPAPVAATPQEQVAAASPKRGSSIANTK